MIAEPGFISAVHVFICYDFIRGGYCLWEWWPF